MPRERILFVTGRLAEPSLRHVLESLAPHAGFDYDVSVLGISVAALMHADWVNRKLQVDEPFDRMILPGWCQGDLRPLEERFRTRIELGPKDLFDLPEHFGRKAREASDLSRYDIEILAEINHAPRMSDVEILAQAEAYRSSGADVIDLGMIPGESWSRAGEATCLLRDAGFRVSIDSFDRAEVEASVSAGAELVLSCNSSNLDWVSRLGVEVVAIPDEPRNAESLERAAAELSSQGCRFRIDPILEPIGFGFAASLERYFTARRKWPNAEIMMGIGNISELTEVDSAGVNTLLAGICQELRIRSVLTTEVINWARSSVAEFNLARRLMRHAVVNHTIPKHVNSDLVMLRDPKVSAYGEEELAQLASRLTDPNFRIIVERGEIHLMNRDGYWRGTDAFEVFDRAMADSPAVDAMHAFYLGYELSKAVTALTLGKQYRQDEALRWGFLTVLEKSAHERRTREK